MFTCKATFSTLTNVDFDSNRFVELINECAQLRDQLKKKVSDAGGKTDFSDELDAYLKKCRQGTNLPLALGFGIKERSDIDFLRGKADIAVIGSQIIRTMEKEGIEAVGEFIRGLRSG